MKAPTMTRAMATVHLASALAALIDTIANEARASSASSATDPNELLALPRKGVVLGVRCRSVLDAAARGELPIVRIGRRVFARHADLESWLRGRTTLTPVPAPADADVVSLFEAAVSRRRTG